MPRMDTDTIRRTPPVAGDEVTTLLGGLERQRGYLAWQCGNLDPAGLRATLGPSTMTLGGLLKHLAAVEDDVFSAKAARPRTRRRGPRMGLTGPDPTGG